MKTYKRSQDPQVRLAAFWTGCTRMIERVLVVKLSDNISLQSISEIGRTFSDGY